MSLSVGGSKSKSSSNMSQTQTETLDPALAAARQKYLTDTQDFSKTPYQSSAVLIDQFMNPYTTDVTNAAMADNERAREMAVNNTAASAQAAGAFGGSRHGVAEALTNSEYDRNNAGIVSALRQGGFNTALGAAQTDNQNAMNWKLALQQLLGAATQGLGTYGTTKSDGTSSTKGSQFGFNGGIKWSPTGGFGG